MNHEGQSAYQELYQLSVLSLNDSCMLIIYADPKRGSQGRKEPKSKVPVSPPTPLKPLPMGIPVLPSAAAAIYSLIFDHGISDIKEILVSRGLQPMTVIKVKG